jgi:hypothetical protein
MDPWIGPAIVAVVSAAGWFVTSWQATRLEQRRRRETGAAEAGERDEP